MASNKFYEPIDKQMVTRLGLNAQPCAYLYGTETKYESGLVFKIDAETYMKIKTILSGKDDVEIKEGDKVFLLPGYPLTHERVKEYLKRIKATLTTDITKATVVASSCDFEEAVSSSYGSQQNLKKTLMFKQSSILVVESTESILPIGEKLEMPCFASFLAKLKLINQNSRSWNSLYEDTYLLTPYLVEILFHVVSKKLKVASLSCLANKANSSVKLDRETFDSIYSMLRSNNSLDLNTGLNLLMHCDYSSEESEYYLWLLAREFTAMPQRIRTNKSLSYFLQTSRWYMLAGMNEEEFLTHRKDNFTLTPTIVNTILPRIFKDTVQDVSSQFNDDYFDIKTTETSITITFNPEWMEILKNSKDAESKPE